MYLSEKLLKNPLYQKTVEEIEKFHFITDGKWDWEHGLGDFKRVSDYVIEILKQLGLMKERLI